VWKKEKNGIPISKKMGCKVAKNERTPNQRDDEDTLHYIQQHKNGIQKKGENEGEKRNSKFSTVAEGMGAERPRKKELTDGCYSGGDSQGLPGFIHPRVLGIPTISFQ